MIWDFVIGIVMYMTGITPVDLLAHIRMTWEKDMMNRNKISDATGEPIYGTVAGDEPAPPPQTKLLITSNSTLGMAFRFAALSTYSTIYPAEAITG